MQNSLKDVEKAANLIMDTFELNKISVALGFEAMCHCLMVAAIAAFDEEKFESFLEDLRIHFKMNKKA